METRKRNFWSLVRPLWSIGGGILVCVAAGCNSLPTSTMNPLAATAAAGASGETLKDGANGEAPKPPPSVQVEFRPLDERPERKAVVMDGEMHVDELMKKVNGFRKYSRCKLQLVRKTPAGNVHRMDISHDRKTKKVDPQTDYFLHAGDVLVVTEDNSGPIMDIINTATGSLGGRVARGMSGG